MNSVGIDISKGKSMVCIMRPFGEIVASPFEVAHTDDSFRELAGTLKVYRVKRKSSWNAQAHIICRWLLHATRRIQE